MTKSKLQSVEVTSGKCIYIELTIAGITPLLMNRFSDAAALAATGGSRSTKVDLSDTPEAICETKLYRSGDDDGVVGIPTMNILASIRDAGRYFKAGKRQLTTGTTSMIPAFVIPSEAFVPLQHKQAWRVDARPIVNPATKGRKLGYRPVFDDWAFNLELAFWPDEFGPKLLRQVVDAAGMRSGLCDFRPARRGPYGRFVVTLWREYEVSRVIGHAAE